MKGHKLDIRNCITCVPGIWFLGEVPRYVSHRSGLNCSIASWKSMASFTSKPWNKMAPTDSQRERAKERETEKHDMQKYSG